MSLSNNQNRHLRKLAHHLKPLVIVGGAGITENLLAEIENTIAHHELIKVRINAADREERSKMTETICEHCQCDLVQSIGHIAIIYKAAKQPVIKLPRT